MLYIYIHHKFTIYRTQCTIQRATLYKITIQNGAHIYKHYKKSARCIELNTNVPICDVTSQWRPAGCPAPTQPGTEQLPTSPGRSSPLRSERRAPAGSPPHHTAAGQTPTRQAALTLTLSLSHTLSRDVWLFVPISNSCNTRSPRRLPAPPPERRTAHPEAPELPPRAVGGGQRREKTSCRWLSILENTSAVWCPFTLHLRRTTSATLSLKCPWPPEDESWCI